MTRLSFKNLGSLSAGSLVPSFIPKDHKIGIVHLGIGAFHRSHQAWYTHKLLELQGGDWRIQGISLRSAQVRDTLNPQDGLYTVVVSSSEGKIYHILGSVDNVLVAPENPQAVITALCQKSVHVVTLTITEKGYCLKGNTGELDEDHQSIVHDLKNLDCPKSALGFLVAACQRRMQANMRGFTVISCDNLAGNGAKLKTAITMFADLVDPKLKNWLQSNVTFPSTMVDRIVPASTPEDMADVQSVIGFEDQACVMTEPFSQWVIENKFAGPVPHWEKVGANLVADVGPFEEMKLRLLNATHSTIAYVGSLAGYTTVADAIADKNLRSLIDHMMADELAPTLSMPEGFDTKAYIESLLRRFTNRGLPHKTRQIAMDGSQKIPQRMLPALRHQLMQGGSIDCLTFGIACWIRYCEGVGENGEVYSVDDPMAAEFQTINGAAKGDAETRLEKFLSMKDVFDEKLASNTVLKEKLLFWLKELSEKKVRSILAQHWKV
ncbi:MAG: mannitol dehydrogenase family protein [SAR324 cluster bacterium]|nr:mannitol dehydrogenase family protein [SAR324 cluster bacterium]